MLPKIKPLYPSVLGNKDKITLCNRVVGALESPMTEDKDCTKLIVAVKDSNNTLKSSISRDNRASAFTGRLTKVVKDRAALIRYLKSLLKSQSLYFLDKNVQKAAEALLAAIIHILRTNTVGTYAGGSIAAEEIVKVCAKKKNKEYVKLLGLETTLAKLAELQAAFARVYTTKVSTEHEKQDVNITHASNQLFDDLMALFGHITSQASLKGGVYAKAIKTINEIIEDVIIAVRSRKARNGNGEEGPEENGNEAVQEQAA